MCDVADDTKINRGDSFMILIGGSSCLCDERTFRAIRAFWPDETMRACSRPGDQTE